MTSPSRSGDARRAYAFAPGHVTGFFRPDLSARDPRARGSTGAGLVLSAGARVEVRCRRGAPTRIEVRSQRRGPWPITEEVARRLVPPRAGSVRVLIDHDLPVGQGFGMSAAGALATALALARLFRIPHQHATEVAHLAELFGGGGLGGVAAIGAGGLEFRARPGVPPYGRVVHQDFPVSVLVGVAGRPIPSPGVLRDDGWLERIDRAARTAWSERRAPSPVEFLEASERFTDDVGLASPALQRLLRALRSEGAWAAQAMFGRSFFAVPRHSDRHRPVLRLLARRRIRPRELQVASSGARAAAQPF